MMDVVCTREDITLQGDARCSTENHEEENRRGVNQNLKKWTRKGHFGMKAWDEELLKVVCGLMRSHLWYEGPSYVREGPSEA